MVEEKDSESADDLVRRVLAGGNPQLESLAAQGVLPLAQEQLVGLQIRLAQRGGDRDEEIARLARDSIAEISLAFMVEYIRQDASNEALDFFLRPETNPALVEAAIQRKGVSPEALVKAAVSLDERAQEVLLLRQDLITENPGILESLAKNAQLSSYSRRLIAEYRRHLLAPEPAEEPLVVEIDLEAELTPEEQAELEEAIAEVRETVEAEGEFDERTGLTEGQVRMLKLPIRVKLARGAGRTLRGILVRDSNPQVAVAVLKASAFSEAEAELTSTNRHVCSEVLAEITFRRDWMGRYQIAHNIVKNPRTPISMAVKLLPRLSVRDLGLLRKDRNVPEAVRQMAVRLHVAKSR